MTKQALLSTHSFILKKERKNNHNFQFKTEEVSTHWLHVFLINWWIFTLILIKKQESCDMFNHFSRIEFRRFFSKI